MKVLFLNINELAGRKNKWVEKDGEWIKDANDINIAIRILDKIFNISEPEVIFFSEFNMHEEAGQYVIDYLEKTKKYKRVYPNRVNKINKDYTSIVLAFTKEKILSEVSKAIAYRWNEIVYKGYRLVGVHFPSELEKWRTKKQIKTIWKTVYYHYKNHENENIIFFGDMNVFNEGTVAKEWFDKLIKAGAKDAWVEKYPNSSIQESYTHITIYNKELVRLDYAIMSESAYNNLIDIKNLKVFIEENLSDHSGLLLELKDTKKL